MRSLRDLKVLIKIVDMVRINILSNFTNNTLFVFQSGQPLKDSERATIRAVHNWFITRRRGHKNRNLSQKSNPNMESNESSLSLYHDGYNSSMDLGSYNNLIDPEQDEQDSSQNFEESFAVKME